MKNRNTSEGGGRLRTLKIWEILERETDEENPMSTQMLLSRLRDYGIDAHRSTLYEDIKLLNECGYEIMSLRGRSNLYYVMDRRFSDPELHILMDAVQAASFITEKKTAELVDKVAALSGSRKKEMLKQNIVRFNTVKSKNESIYYSVSEIIAAINACKKIIFRYFDYDIAHRRVYRREGHHYVVSPFATVFSDGQYYLVVYDGRFGKMLNYRIDRMDGVQIIEETAEMPPKELAFDIASYKKSLFGMFSGETVRVTIEADRSLIDAVFDLFGDQTRIAPKTEQTVTFTANVQLSYLFFGWCSSFGEKVRLLAPEKVVCEYKKYIDDLKNRYL